MTEAINYENVSIPLLLDEMAYQVWELENETNRMKAVIEACERRAYRLHEEMDGLRKRLENE